MKRAVKIIGYSLGLILFVAAVLAGLTQSKLFKDRLRVFLVSSITTNTNASLNLGTIQGNFVTGFTVDSLRMLIDGEEFVSTGRITVTYDFLSFPRRSVLIHKLTIEKPRMVLQRGADSVWNVGKLGGPEEPQEPGGPFSWAVRINELLVVNGSVVVQDRLALSSPDHLESLPHQVEYHDIALDSIYLNCGGQYTDREAQLSVRNLSFRSSRPSFRLRKLNGEFAVSSRGAEAKSLTVETARSRFKLSAALQQANLFEGIELKRLQRKPMRLTLLADDIDLNELKSFIAPIDFLDGSAYVDLDASGEFGNFALNRLNVQTYNTSLKITGHLRNLHRPEDLYIHADFQDSRVTPHDADRLLPPFHIPRFENVGTMPISGQFSGKPLNFTASMLTAGELGTLQAEAKINLEGNRMEYDATFQTKDFEVRRFADDSPFPARLTSTGAIKGIGTSPRTMEAGGEIQLDSSLVRDMLLMDSNLKIEVKNRILRGIARINSGETKLSLTAQVDYRRPDKSGFTIASDVDRLDLSKLFGDNHFRSSIRLTATALGSGSNLDDLSGTMKLLFGPSTFHSYPFDDEEIVLKLNQEQNDSKKIELSSSAAEVRVSGRFAVSDVIERLREEFLFFAAAMRQKSALLGVRSVSGAPSLTPGHASHDPGPSFSFDYLVNVKNLQPISLFLGGAPFNGRGMAKGRVTAESTVFALTCSTSAEEIFVGSIDHGGLAEDVDLRLGFTSAHNPRERHTVADYMDGMTATIQAGARSAIWNKKTFDNTIAYLSYDENVSRFDLRSTIDSLVTVSTRGVVATDESRFEVSIDTLSLAFGTPLWVNYGSPRLIADPSGFRLEHFALRRGEGEISLMGTLRHDGNVDGQLTVRNFDVAGLGNYVGVDELVAPQGFSGLFDVDLTVNGTTAKPKMVLTAAGREFGYRGKTFGFVNGKLTYQDLSLDVDAKIGSAKEVAPLATDLIVSGDVPINLGFSDVDRRFPDRPMSLVARSEGFDIDLLDPLFTSFDELRGKASCILRVEGTPSRPLYNGTISFTDVRFLFAPNGVRYNLTGKLKAIGDRIDLADVRVTNDPKDRSDGAVIVGGFLTIRDFSVDAFDLTANGQLLLMKESSRRSLRNLYGTLFAAIGAGGLRFQGSFSQSHLSGTVVIKEANLIFPPTRESAYSTIESSLNYVVIDDTSYYGSSQQKLSEQFFGNGEPGRERGSNATRTVWDGMAYDLLVETEGTTEIRMIFNQATNEELYAALDGRVVLQRGERGPTVIGEIAVAERSYYNFFKKFSASGALKFVGSPENPELDITASYHGTRIPPGDKDTSDQKVAEQKVVVTLDITGTRYEPRIAVSMTVDGANWTSDAKGGDVQSDAIPFILTGKFRDDLTSQEKSDIVTSLSSSAGSSLLYGLPSQMLSGVLSDFLRSEFDFIRSAELTYSGGSLQESADLRLSGELGRAYWQLGGRIFNSIGNANVSFQLSMGDVLSTPNLKNLYVELERKVEGTEIVDQKKLTNTARVFYKISF